MITVDNKSKCTGCAACMNACPKKCIEMELDAEGFLYPVIDTLRCINCNLCNKVCHMENAFSRNQGYSCVYYGAYNKSKEIKKDSSSGGIFWELAEHVIRKNGVVYGVELNDRFHVAHGRATNIRECEKFRKSKYLESNIRLTLIDVKKDLDEGHLVLFSGTPCQIAGLYSYINNDYDNLITCDVVCHGVPSKAVFNKYIDELNIKTNDKATSIVWRDKRLGWKPNRVSIQFESGKEIINTSSDNPYQRGFLQNLYLRPSCYKCPYAKLPRISDISLADFWGYDGDLKNTNEGLSIVIISSDLGKKIFEKVMDSCEVEEVTENYVKQKSRHVHRNPRYNKNRDFFFKDFNCLSFEQVRKKYISPSLVRRCFTRLIKIITR